VPLFVLLFAGLRQVLEAMVGAGPIHPEILLERYLPPHVRPDGTDPFEAVETLLAKVMEVAGTLSLVAIPAFVWVSTRLFGGVRTSLNNIFDVSIRPRRGHFLVLFVRNKLRDLGMVLTTLVLFLVYTALTFGLSWVQAYSKGRFGEGVFSPLLRVGGELMGFGFLIAVFFFLYRYASTRRMPWQGALLAASVMAGAFELAKRLYGLYLQKAAPGAAGVDATAGALILFVVWVYYSALVFLLGGVLVETFELRRLQRIQRA
jgi:membrane protein